MLLSNNGYYAQRLPGQITGSYWQPKRDPDGVFRDRCTEVERLQYLADMKDELAFADCGRGARVLDFGAGLGWFLGAMNRTCTTKHAIETDVTAKAHWPADIVDIGDLFRGAQDEYYDLIICHHVIEHCERPCDIIRGLQRCLKYDGCMIFGTPDFDSPCARRFGANYRMLHDLTHISLFTRASAERFLFDHGFEILDVRYPFPDRYATAENFARWNDVSKVSPPWPGNWMTFYAQLR